ncbi:pseudouridine synthase [Alkalimarinus coralli]|uniref:pseudouridine synthase n=1 Tax=Alkalimarinus coralli TaxID=2935863 RepID=UPI00202B1D5D|nr:pseudouridine synthase [Alkalimarinus coralli]
MDAKFSLTVTDKQAGITLIDCLLPCIPYLSREKWCSLLESGQIKVNGVAISENIQTQTGQVIDYTVPDYQEAAVDPNWSLLWSNDEIAAIHKPANLPVNRTTRNVYNTLIQLLRRESPWPNAHLLHRLDIETSGVILIGQNNEVARKYQPALPGLIKRKIYHAVVYGTPEWTALDYECDLATLPDSPIRCQMHKVKRGEGKYSRTGFSVLSSTEGFSLVRCELMTGRKHQIRAHLAALGHPIVGDKIYSLSGEMYLKRINQPLTGLDNEKLVTSHHLLHAYELHLHNLSHPADPELVIRDDNFPPEWREFVKNNFIEAER